MFSIGNSTISTIAATLVFLWFPGEPRETLGTFSEAQPLPAPRPPNYIYYIFFIYFLFNLPSSTQGFPTSTATPRPGPADSRGLRPLTPTPKKQNTAKRILRCDKSSAQFELRRHALYASSTGNALSTYFFRFHIQKSCF